MSKALVAIVMGSKTDLKVMKAAAKILKEFHVAHEIKIVSAHRTPEEMVDFAKTAVQRYKLIIAGAGGAAHLPGMLASLTTLPVIGVPVTSTNLKGLDALLSIAQMPSGVPVATVGVDNSKNAALLALRILAIENPALTKKLLAFQKAQKTKVKLMNQALRSRSLK